MPIHFLRFVVFVLSLYYSVMARIDIENIQNVNPTHANTSGTASQQEARTHRSVHRGKVASTQ